MLIEDHEMDVNAVVADGGTPLKISQKNGNAALIRLLKSHGAK